MTTLWLAVVALLVATLFCLIPPLLRRAPAAEGGSDASVRAFYLAQRDQLRRDLDSGALNAEAHARAEEELQRDLLQDLALRRVRGAPLGGQRAGIAAACLLSVAIPVGAVLLYGQLGNPRAAADMVMARAPEPHAADTADDMALAVNALAQRLRAAPDDADGWYMLARSFETLGRFNDAVAAYQQVLRLVPGQPAVLADLADALLS
ncbi:c-type cytochrome biogenesis protein CcmI, partial [Achromobacter spanius]|uniref:c-type cytochrome biogenesis protein CcmI n=1 Tax=Achromobacter spanius TaxID=217203 RepID=UPI0032094CA4